MKQRKYFNNDLINHRCCFFIPPLIIIISSFIAHLFMLFTKWTIWKYKKNCWYSFLKFVGIFASKFHVISTRVPLILHPSHLLRTLARIWYDLTFSYTPLIPIEGYGLLRIQFELHHQQLRSNLFVYGLSCLFLRRQSANAKTTFCSKLII